MAKIKSLEQLMSDINSSLELLEESRVFGAEPNHVNFHQHESLLDACNIVASDARKKPQIRVIHHFACSGGTLVSKCLAALPNVFLFSELHPTSTLHMGDGTPRFLPSDVTTHARYAGVPSVDDLAWKLFAGNIQIANQHIRDLGGYMVIRDHTHSDYCVGNNLVTSSTVVEHLRKDFDILKVVTLRNPIDSFLSLQKNGWVHFQPANFEEYCRRLRKFLSQFDKSEIIRYEDIVKYPKRNIKKIARKLNLPYSSNFIETFSAFKVTGDSGRTGDVISSRPRRELSKDFEKEISNSKSYQYVADKFGY
tara:strand:- start:7156 stop:8079 length:924 start_codon:yes stop_codon:yes gene_type:complete